MKSIAEIFDNSNQMIDSIHNFFDRYIGNDLLRKCRISKIVDKIINKEYEYDQENPFFRLLGGALMESKVIQKVVMSSNSLVVKIILQFDRSTYIIHMYEYKRNYYISQGIDRRRR